MDHPAGRVAYENDASTEYCRFEAVAPSRHTEERGAPVTCKQQGDYRQYAAVEYGIVVVANKEERSDGYEADGKVGDKLHESRHEVVSHFVFFLVTIEFIHVVLAGIFYGSGIESVHDDADDRSDEQGASVDRGDKAHTRKDARPYCESAFESLERGEELIGSHGRLRTACM